MNPETSIPPLGGYSPLGAGIQSGAYRFLAGLACHPKKPGKRSSGILEFLRILNNLNQLWLLERRYFLPVPGWSPVPSWFGFAVPNDDSKKPGDAKRSIPNDPAGILPNWIGRASQYLSCARWFGTAKPNQLATAWRIHAIVCFATRNRAAKNQGKPRFTYEFFHRINHIREVYLKIIIFQMTQ
jgi:hypothetical protein